MPSVRVKRHDYASLREGSQIQRRRSLASLFPPARPVSALGRVEDTSSRLQTTQNTANQTPLLPNESPQLPHPNITTRPRAWSRVYGSIRGGQAPLLGNSPSSPRASADEVVTLEGSTTDVQIPAEGQPGLIGSALSLPQDGETQRTDDANYHHHHDDIVEHLDVIDPQVATVSHLTNAANSILIPPLSWYSRKPVVMLSAPPAAAADKEKASYEDALDRHVDDLMKRRARLKRVLMGVWSFLKTPMGIITGIYGFLVVFWGAAIVFFLGKIINLHNADLQGFWVEVSSQVVNGLFTVTGIGFIPWRVLDTYRISKIYHYKRKTEYLRAKAGLPQLYDRDDLPDPRYDPNYVHVLTKEEENDLHRQQVKFQHQQTWYRAHGTETHRAFPIGYALVICCLNDANSIFQAMLCGCMWSMNRFERPPWTTGTLIPAGFICGILSAVFIAKGSSVSKRTAEVKERLKTALEMEHPESLSEINLPENFQLRPTIQSAPTPSLSIDNDPEKQNSGTGGLTTELDVLVEEQMIVPSNTSKLGL